MIGLEITPQGKSTFADISEFLLFSWNNIILGQYIQLVEKTTNQLLLNPYLGKPFSKTIRKIVLHKNASMYYEYNEENQLLTILLFIDNRQNPKDYIKLL